MTGSKPVALPLGYAPTRRAANISEHPVWMQRRNVTCIVILVYNPDMVDPSMPWSLKNISDEAREFAKLSADKSDVPVGAWLSQVIRAGAAAAPAAPSATEIDSPPPATAPVQPAPSIAPAPKPAPAPKAARGGSTIERAAQIVDDFGFEPEGPADGQMGRRTADTIRLYQKFAGKDEDGAPRRELLEDLRAVANTMSKDG